MSHESLEAGIARIDAIKKKEGCFLNRYAGCIFAGCLTLSVAAGLVPQFFVSNWELGGAVGVAVFGVTFLLAALILHIERWWHGVGPFFSKHPLT